MSRSDAPEPPAPLRQAGDDLKARVLAAAEEELLALLHSGELDEPHLALLLGRLDISSKIVSAVAALPGSSVSESIRFQIARHPRAPRRIALPLLRQLFLFDLVRVSLAPTVPAEIRRTAEEILTLRIPNLPVGQKLTLARRGPSRVVGALLAEGHPQAIQLALDNALLTESQILKVLANHAVPFRVVAAIAQHPRWSLQYNIRAALVRHPHTPPPCILSFLANLTLRDLKEIAAVETLSPHSRKYIRREIDRRAGQPPTPNC
jgi:hypothetical protein